MDEDWIVSEARNYRKSDVSAAKSLLIVGRTLFPRNVDIQFEIYQLEKSHRNVREAAKVFEEMTLSFSQEMRLWSEIAAMSEALQSDIDDENNSFLRELFNALPPGLQQSMLLNAAESVKDALHQCRLLLLVVDRYPAQVEEQGIKLVDLLIQAEKVAKCSSPVNCYRKYLACNALPMLLRGGVPVSAHKHFFLWLEKAIEFYVCYITQSSSPPDSGSRNSGGNSTSIVGLTDKESNITDPWNQLYQLMQIVASQQQWKFGRSLLGDNKELQWQQLSVLHENLCLKPGADVSSGQREQLFYISIICFLRSLHSYTSSIESSTGNAVGNHEFTKLVLVESFAPVLCTDFGEPSYLEHRSKKLKTESEIPSISVSDGVSADVVINFTTAFRYWRLLHSDLLKNDFMRLCQQWSTDCWTALQNFEVDAFICQGLFQEAAMILKNSSSLAVNNSRFQQLRMNLQLSSCYYSLGNFSQSCQFILDIISSQTANPDTPRTSSSSGIKGCRTTGRQLQLLSTTEAEVMSYSISLLIACLKERAWKMNMDDMLLGHMIVLSQYDWPRYEFLFCDIIQAIKSRGHFTYNLFFSYVIDIDMLEEFAFIWTAEGGHVNLDIMPNSAKGTAQARTVTRGVNKVVKEDLKLAMERQVLRSHENVNNLLRHFLIDERDLLKQNFSM